MLAPKPEAIKDWDKLSDDEKSLFARQMEVFAGFGEYADTEIGRLIDTIRRTRAARQHAGLLHHRRQRRLRRGRHERPLQRDDLFQRACPRTIELQISSTSTSSAGRYGHNHYAAGWAVAGDTPFTWTKQIAGSYGGTRNGMVVYWPKGIKAKNEVRSQWHHVIDVAPTVLEAAGLPRAEGRQRHAADPDPGRQHDLRLQRREGAEIGIVQYFEIAGNRGVYADGWLAGTIHRAPWEDKPRAALKDDVWELYDTRQDFSLAHDLAASNPEKLEEMQAIFLSEAVANHVLPIDDRAASSASTRRSPGVRT